jgi:hypothetical protein
VRRLDASLREVHRARDCPEVGLRDAVEDRIVVARNTRSAAVVNETAISDIRRGVGRGCGIARALALAVHTRPADIERRIRQTERHQLELFRPLDNHSAFLICATPSCSLTIT